MKKLFIGLFLFAAGCVIIGRIRKALSVGNVRIYSTKTVYRGKESNAFYYICYGNVLLSIVFIIFGLSMVVIAIEELLFM